MIPELGHFALVLALLLAVLQGTLPIVGAARRHAAWMALARPAARGQLLFVVIAFACLSYAFVTHDFSVAYVASNSNTSLPLQYRLAAVWGGHEGSLLLWTLMLAVWTVAVSVFSRGLPATVVARVLGVMGILSGGFLLFMLLASNPFERLHPAPADGRDLNPLLQDVGMVIHPPMLYMGYVGFSVAFAFAIAALLSGQLNATWARWARPWTTMAWVFLTLGIMLGSAWAYYELGWGGWWFWDPVENASFMPWLVGTALLHSLAVTEKRNAFRNWTVLLAILAFSLSLLGTFLVRSGVLTSVHAFASDPKRGIFILVFLSLVIGGSLLLFAWRAPKVGLGGDFSPLSRESLLLTNNVLLLVAAGSVLLGTMYPLFLDALNIAKLSVGPPYFESVFFPLMVPAVFLMGVGPLARWKEARLPELAMRLRWAMAVAVVSAALAPWLMGSWKPLVSVGLLLAFWILASQAVNLAERIASTPGPLLSRFARQPRSYNGMLLAHAAVGVFIIGVTLVKGYETGRDLRMQVGDVVEVGGYHVRFEGTTRVEGPNYQAVVARIVVLEQGREARVLEPERRYYPVQGTAMTEAAIDTRWRGDLYVSLAEPVDRQAWVLRVQSKPFVDWIWVGCLLMAMGGLLAVLDRRYRVPSRAPQSVPSPEQAKVQQA
jgi:cytochrome c-type biogenesis protein CcmF